MSAPPAAPPRRILVSGDLVVDHHVYQGERLKPSSGSGRGVRHVQAPGGAAGLCALLTELGAQDGAITAALGTELPCSDSPTDSHHAFALWRPQRARRAVDATGLVWRTGLKLGYGAERIVTDPPGDPSADPPPVLRHVAQPPPEVLVLDDAGFAFRKAEHRSCWHLPNPGDAVPWILLKLAEPIAQGDLWRALMAGPGLADRLVCLISARDLRYEPVRINGGVSWEATLEDLGDALRSPVLAPLRACRHLVITFAGDGALWIDRESPDIARFCFDPAGIEGSFAAQFDGESIGYLTAMAAALALALAKTPATAPANLGPAMAAGLRAMRDLLARGHGVLDEAVPIGYPVDRLAAVIGASDADPNLASVAIAWPRPDAAQRAKLPLWSITVDAQRPLGASTGMPRAGGSLVGLALEVARRGSAAYGRLPHLRFGKFVTAERAEIEALRVIHRQMTAYRAMPPGARPLSIGVFGPPGAGKSFAVRAIAEAIFGAAAWLEFNLSQFDRTGDLNGAFHQIRDRALAGEIPVVFWDEFDAQKFRWLQYLLAPMQDGRFQQGPLSHAVSRCVFIFAGGTCPRFAAFGPDGESVTDTQWKLLKGPDFRSRLDAVHDVAGPNRRTGADASEDATDTGYVLRRALLMRGQLGLDSDGTADIDPALLRALLLAPAYRNGARSLEKLLNALHRRPGEMLRRSDLPPRAQLDMHVDATAFLAVLDRDAGFAESALIEALAEAAHTDYLATARKQGWPIAAASDRRYGALDEGGKQANRAAARRIPRVLALAGLGVQPAAARPRAAGPSADDLVRHLEHNLERLAEDEHEGWMAFRLCDGWRYGETRDNDRKLHPLLVPYARLTQVARDLDRDSVRAYPVKIRLAGYRAVWL